MAKVSLEIIEAIRRTAVKLEECTTYQSEHLDNLIREMLALGLESADLKNLERLSNRDILRTISSEKIDLHFKDDVIKYLHAWATHLEEELLNDIELPSSIYNRVTIL